MKKSKWLLFMLLLLPVMVFASESEMSESYFAFIVVLVISFPYYSIVIKPLSSLLINKGYAIFQPWLLMILRFIVLLSLIPSFPSIYILDYLVFFVGGILLSAMKQSPINVKGVTNVNTSDTVICPKCKIINKQTSLYCAECGAALVRGASNISDPLKCPKCDSPIMGTEKFCRYCGENVENLTAKNDNDNKILFSATGSPVNKSAFDSALINGTEDAALLSIVKKELAKDASSNGKTISVVENRKKIMTLIYALIMFVIVSIFMFYHTYGGLFLVIGALGTAIYIGVLRNYNLQRYLVKESKKRPDEKISYVVSSVLQGTREKNIIDKLLPIAIILFVVWISLYLYSTPHMIFEKQSEGYAVRYYTYGIFKNEKTIKIPSEYKGEKVIGIRGDTFKNVYTVHEVILPPTIKEIRGGAFQNCVSLETINLPVGLKEIHGSTFEGCSSLKAIAIPKGVTRIGGSAFRDCYNLTDVTIPMSVGEIGSSAFRNTRVSNVCISESTYVNERAFKNTYPTIVYYEDGCESSNDYEYDYGDYGSE